MANEKNAAFWQMKGDILGYLMETYEAHGQVDFEGGPDDDLITYDVTIYNGPKFALKLSDRPGVNGIKIAARREDDAMQSDIKVVIPVYESKDGLIGIVRGVIDKLIASKPSASDGMKRMDAGELGLLFDDNMSVLTHMSSSIPPIFSVHIAQSSSGGDEVRIHLIHRNGVESLSPFKTITCDSPERAGEVAADYSEMTERLVDHEAWRNLVLKAKRNRISELRSKLSDGCKELENPDSKASGYERASRRWDEETELRRLDSEAAECERMTR